jgi:hypothetical protein
MGPEREEEIRRFKHGPKLSETIINNLPGVFRGIVRILCLLALYWIATELIRRGMVELPNIPEK